MSRYEEHLWKISLQTNKYAKIYHVDVYIYQSAPSVFDSMMHYASFGTLCIGTYDNLFPLFNFNFVNFLFHISFY